MVCVIKLRFTVALSWKSLSNPGLSRKYGQKRIIDLDQPLATYVKMLPTVDQ